ncbi:Adducin protein 1 [Fasciola hepatica]|uniref:Adducin protein 1 n=1 Tax=Fasciola hepatica TaxID=6192 RepID=A0A4E0REB0_FASHE|nr:Adducin protein 1 [Fasciola hepatica]
MIDFSEDENRNKMNTGDSEFFESKQGNANNKISNTMQSVPDSYATGSIFRSPKSGAALQHLSDLLSQNVKLDGLSEFKDAFRLLSSDFRCSLPTIPINDLRGEEAATYSREECVLRRTLAALYRLIDIHGWTQSIYNHISARCTADPRHFLINPFGLLYHEIQASNLITIDEEGMHYT